MIESLTPEIAIFTRVAEVGSFKAVADETGYTSSGISRMVSRLEDSLHVKLLHRSTRKLALTPEGDRFLAFARKILATVEAAEAEVSKAHGQPKGHLRLNCGTAFANHKLSRLMPSWADMYPEISTDICVSDHRIDPLSSNVDITIRVGPSVDSDLVAIRLGEVERVVAASPAYLSKNGTPRHAKDLHNHNCLLLNGFPRLARWPFLEEGRRIDIAASGSIMSDSAEFLLYAAIAGVGIVRLGDFLGADALASKKLIPILVDTHFSDPQPITALVAPGRQSIPRIRAFIDFLRANL